MAGLDVTLDLYAASIICTMLILFITCVDVASHRMISRYKKAIAVAVSIAIALAGFGEYLGVITNGAPEKFIRLHEYAKLSEFCLTPFIGVFAGIAYGDRKRPKAALTLASLHAIFEILALNKGWVFTIDANNIYHREILYPIYLFAFLSAVTYSFVCVFKKNKRYQAMMDTVLRLMAVMLALSIGTQIVFKDVRIDFLCCALVNLLLYINYCRLVLQIDAVTRLLSRRCFDVRITSLTSRAVIAVFDLDDFKSVNDNYGHSVGDLCLKNTAQILRSVFGRYGLCYRTGGDEFSIILNIDIEQVGKLCDELHNQIEKLREEDPRMAGISVGYALYEPGKTHSLTALETADAMLYRNKSGKKGVTV